MVLLSTLRLRASALEWVGEQPARCVRAALAGLIDQVPTMHAALGATLTGATRPIEASAFEFISEHAQIQQVREFMQVLPGRLR